MKKFLIIAALVASPAFARSPEMDSAIADLCGHMAEAAVNVVG